MAPAYPMLAMFWLSIAIKFFGDGIDLLAKCIPALKSGVLELNENLDSYYNHLDDIDRNWSIKEEEYYAKKEFCGGLKILTEDTLNQLSKGRQEKPAHEHLIGVHCYDILANPDCANAFGYVSNDRSPAERKKLIVDGDDDEDNDEDQVDLIRLVLNLGFLNRKDFLNFTFQKGKLREKNLSIQKSEP